ncbi:MAG: response regulator transcription factor [Chloroflexales bacterium]|nr:response regulator transcription factor [Chloroflexales bacterium]
MHVVTTIVVSRPGVMQQALRTSLAACPPIVVIASAGDGLTALRQIAAHHPALVVIDANLLPDESEALLAAIKAAPMPPRCLVFVQSSLHETLLLAAGADAVMRRDESAQELQATLARLTQP